MNESELRLPRGIRATLSAIREEIRSIRDQQERHSSQEHPPSPTPVLRAELQVPERIERNNQGNNDREHRTQIWLTVGTWLAFIAAAVYAAIAYKQKVTMDATF